MKKKFKCGLNRCLSIVTVVATLLLIYQPVVYGTNTNKAWTAVTTVWGESYVTTNKSKKNDSSCCVNYSKGNSNYITAKILARKNKDSGTWRDVTYPVSKVYYVYQNAGSFVEVKNLAYEKYGQNSTKKKCYAKLKVTPEFPGTTNGFWRPDKY